MKYIYPFNSNGQPLSKRQKEIRAETKSKEDILDDLFMDDNLLVANIRSSLRDFSNQNPPSPSEDYSNDEADQNAVQQYLDRATEAVRKAFERTFLSLANKAGKKSRLTFTGADVKTLVDDELKRSSEYIESYLYA